ALFHGCRLPPRHAHLPVSSLGGVTHVPGLMCYLCTRFVPPRVKTQTLSVVTRPENTDRIVGHRGRRWCLGQWLTIRPPERKPGVATFPRKRARRPRGPRCPADPDRPAPRHRREPPPGSDRSRRRDRAHGEARSRRAGPAHLLAAGPSWAFPRKRPTTFPQN